MSMLEALGAAALFLVIVGLTLRCAGVLTVSIGIDEDEEG